MAGVKAGAELVEQFASPQGPFGVTAGAESLWRLSPSTLATHRSIIPPLAPAKARYELRPSPPPRCPTS